MRARVWGVLLTAALVQGCNCGVVVGNTGGGSGGNTGTGGGSAGGSGGGTAGGSGGGTAGGAGGGTAGGTGGGTAGGTGGGTAGGTGGGTAGGAGGSGGGTAGGAGGGTAGGAGGGTAGGAGGGTAGGAGGGTGGAGPDGGVNIGCAVVVPIRHDAGTMDGFCANPLAVPTVPALVYGDTRTGFDTQTTCNIGAPSSERNYRITLPTSGELTIDLTNLSRDAGFVPVLGLYDNCQFNMGLPHGCLAAHGSEGVTSMVVPNLDAGSYIVAIDGMGTTPGDFSLAFCLRPPHVTLTGDTCADPQPLTFTNQRAHVEDNTNGAQDDVTFIKPSGLACKGGSAVPPAERVYSFDLPDAGSGQWDVQARVWTLTTDYVQPIAVFTDVCPLSGTLADAGVLDCGSGSLALAGAPFTSNLVHRFGGGRHYVWTEFVSQLNPATPAQYALDVRYALVGSVANDACNATSSPQLMPNASYAGSLLGATNHLDNPVCADNSGQAGLGADVFYRYVAPATGTARFEVEGERGTGFYVGLFSGCAASSCLTMQNLTGPSTTAFSFAVTQGTTYLVMVEEYDYNPALLDPGDGFRGVFGIRVSQ